MGTLTRLSDYKSGKPPPPKSPYDEVADALESFRNLIGGAVTNLHFGHAKARWDACFLIAKNICAYIYETPQSKQGYVERLCVITELYGAVLRLPESEERYCLLQCVRVWMQEGTTSSHDTGE